MSKPGMAGKEPDGTKDGNAIAYNRQHFVSRFQITSFSRGYNLHNRINNLLLKAFDLMDDSISSKIDVRRVDHPEAYKTENGIIITISPYDQTFACIEMYKMLGMKVLEYPIYHTLANTFYIEFKDYNHGKAHFDFLDRTLGVIRSEDALKILRAREEVANRHLYELHSTIEGGKRVLIDGKYHLILPRRYVSNSDRDTAICPFCGGSHGHGAGGGHRSAHCDNSLSDDSIRDIVGRDAKFTAPGTNIVLKASMGYSLEDNTENFYTV